MRRLSSGRRRFLKVGISGAGALVLAPLLRAEPAPPGLPPELLGDELVELGPFIRIERDNRVVIGNPVCEVGQGDVTVLPMLVAEDLDVDWQQVQVIALPWGYVRTAGGTGNLYGDQYGPRQHPAARWQALREAGASARWMLLRAASLQWNVAPGQLWSDAGHVHGPGGRRLSYGELAAAAARIPPPEIAPPLRAPTGWQVIGTPQASANAAAVVTGRLRHASDEFGADALIAVIARSPFPGGTLHALADGEARRVAGVVDVLTLPAAGRTLAGGAPLAAGVAVLARHSWAALQARERLEIEWNPGPELPGSNELSSRGVAFASDPEAGVEARRDGDPDAALAAAARVVSARYLMPFVAHDMAEPPVAIADVRSDRVRLVAAVEDPDATAHLAAGLTGLPLQAVEIRMPQGGGSFGRRLRNDWVAEAVLLSREAARPVKLVWTRDDALHHDFYRPFAVASLQAGLDRRGFITGWSHRCAATAPDMGAAPVWQGCMAADAFPAGLVADLERRFLPLENSLPLGPWLGGAGIFDAFATESFIDELAVATRRDALELRLELLDRAPRMAGPEANGAAFDTWRMARALQRCADRLGWGRRRSDGHGLGLACHHAGGALAAVGLEVSVRGERLVLHKAVVTVAAGAVVNPRTLEARVTTALTAALSDAMYGEVRIVDGQVRPGTRGQYRQLGMAGAPRVVEVENIAAEIAPVRIDDVVAAAAAPALANAVYAGTTARVRRLPLMPEFLRLL